MDIYVLTNARSDGKPVVAFDYSKAILMLSLGARGGVWKVSNPAHIKRDSNGDVVKDDNGNSVTVPFMPTEVNCWRKGQMPRPMADLILSAVEDGDAGKPLVQEAAKVKKGK